jgi:hypothetical protein
MGVHESSGVHGSTGVHRSTGVRLFPLGCTTTAAIPPDNKNSIIKAASILYLFDLRNWLL